uniref:Metallo-beta-lactamase domain-containing protein n=1 Tax=Chromera velia CCMP2878 TaxID=1169474 RepID=A0A0G4HRD2_9ALVE|eukprot:Cvel_8084.t1-p1 / transcript=Cvel_8084.t1 / gene=Cvel_8084 / organism=Chromera_velia_CCMP2878 / gene_product=hypothetical protein / transcript_product=hypothetical protein / location=Cvel_scaffold438:79390-83250(+) / protein_length=308 / sequence_SO=supercontig / SO=protein_coding / is_pseudo=false
MGFSIPFLRQTDATIESNTLSGKSQNGFELTWLESNSWFWKVNGVSLLVDPVIEGALDFGIPSVYSGVKKIVPSRVAELPPQFTAGADAVLITQGLDDHCHLRTLKALAKILPELVPLVVAPSAFSKVASVFGEDRVRVLRKGEATKVKALKGGGQVRVEATEGALVGPPWQARENGYIVYNPKGKSLKTLYYEPHCDTSSGSLEGKQADIVITPVTFQRLFGVYDLVKGGREAITLARSLGAKVVVPMQNGDLISEGPLAKAVVSEGSVDSFKRAILMMESEEEGGKAGESFSPRVVDARALETIPL